jgi:hypothetical protein
LPLTRRRAVDTKATAQSISCQQAIAADGCFAVAMLAEFDPSLSAFGAWFYRALHWESGLVGQVLYLAAERAGVRATGIGCFFDPLTHDALGIQPGALRVVYHFTVGGPLDDARLQTLDAYHHLGG